GALRLIRSRASRAPAMRPIGRNPRSCVRRRPQSQVSSAICHGGVRRSLGWPAAGPSVGSRSIQDIEGRADMSPNDEPVSFAPKPGAAETRKTRNAAEPPAGRDLISITLDAASGTIVGLERVDAGGARHEISDDDRTRLTSARATLEQVVEQAFEA